MKEVPAKDLYGWRFSWQKNMQHLRKQRGVLLVGGMSALLVACGGGSSGSASPVGSSTAAVQLTDAPGDFSHVWVTVRKIAFHSSATQTWSASDSTWQTYTLPAPVTLDLAALSNGQLQNVFSSIQLPVGVYRQMRLFLDGPASALDSSAQALQDSNGNALQWNDQVERNENGQWVEYSLNVPFAAAGIRLGGTFNVVAGSNLNLAVDINLNKSIVAYHRGQNRGYILNPWLTYFDMAQVGAIAGSLDPSQLCPLNGQGQPMPAATCVYNVVVKAEAFDKTQNRYASLRTTVVRPDGTFLLYPVSVQDAGGNTIDYHVLIRGRNMETMVVKHVPVVAGASAQSNATLLPQLMATVNPGEYLAQWASPLAPLTSGYAVFMQTDPSESAPYSVRYRATDPSTGTYYDPLPLENSGLLTTTYSSGATALNFVAVTPKEGMGNYSVGVDDFGDYLMNTNFTTLQAPATGSSAMFSFTTPQAGNQQAGALAGNLAISAQVASQYQHMMLYVANASNVLTSQDLSASLASSSGSIAYSVNGLSSGSPWNVYYVYLRLWSNTNPRGELIALPGFANLSQQATATLNGTIAH